MSSEHVGQFVDTLIGLTQDDLDFPETDEQLEQLQTTLENVGQACEEMDRTIAADEYDDRIAQGVATLLSGTTEVTVEYDLPETPDSVIITPQGEPAGFCWVDNIGEGNFTIATATGPAADLDFSWVALVPEGFQQEEEENVEQA